MAEKNFYINIHAGATAPPVPSAPYIQPISEMARLVLAYYKVRELSWPDFPEALTWAVTELGEAGELYMSKQCDRWKRNNPADKEEYDPDRLGEELGDAIMMLIVAGLVNGVDPVNSLIDKLERKSNGEISIFR